MSFKMIWRVNIKNLQTKIRVGICDHERKAPQNILINAIIDYESSANPQSINECFNYDSIHQLVVEKWQEKGHTDLLETLVFDLLTYIFSSDGKVKFSRVSVSKPDIYDEAEAVGIEAEWIREDYKKFTGKS